MSRKACERCRQCQRHCRCDKYEPPLVKEMTLNVLSYDVRADEKPDEKGEYFLVFESRKAKQKVTLEGLPDYRLTDVAETILKTTAAKELRLTITEETLQAVPADQLESVFRYFPERRIREIIKAAREILGGAEEAE
jgi:hypothetical protein